jgi:hypothetical protein
MIQCLIDLSLGNRFAIVLRTLVMVGLDLLAFTLSVVLTLQAILRSNESVNVATAGNRCFKLDADRRSRSTVGIVCSKKAVNGRVRNSST